MHTTIEAGKVKKNKIELPEGIRAIPELVKEVGYFTCIGSGLHDFNFRSLPSNMGRKGNTDYNFDWGIKYMRVTTGRKGTVISPFSCKYSCIEGKYGELPKNIMKFLKKEWKTNLNLNQLLRI